MRGQTLAVAALQSQRAGGSEARSSGGFTPWEQSSSAQGNGDFWIVMLNKEWRHGLENADAQEAQYTEVGLAGGKTVC